MNLTVRDPVADAGVIRELFGLDQRYDHTSDDRQLRYIVVENPTTGFVLGLVGHAANPGDAFDETRTGLDHLEFLVERREDLDEGCASDDLGVLTQVSNTSITPTTGC